MCKLRTRAIDTALVSTPVPHNTHLIGQNRQRRRHDARELRRIRLHAHFDRIERLSRVTATHTAQRRREDIAGDGSSVGDGCFRHGGLALAIDRTKK